MSSLELFPHNVLGLVLGLPSTIDPSAPSSGISLYFQPMTFPASAERGCDDDARRNSGDMTLGELSRAACWAEDCQILLILPRHQTL